MYKKSQEGAINIIVIVVIGALVAAAALYFIYTGREGAGTSISIADAKSICETACFQDSQKEVEIPTNEDGSCGLGLAVESCSKFLLVGERRMRCYELTDCLITMPSGRNCRVSERSC